jgi:hypothetical protein
MNDLTRYGSINALAETVIGLYKAELVRNIGLCAVTPARIRLTGADIFEPIFAGHVPTFVPTTPRTRWNRGSLADARPNSSAVYGRVGHRLGTYTLFEGTSEIQRLVVARALSGMHIP